MAKRVLLLAAAFLMASGSTLLMGRQAEEGPQPIVDDKYGSAAAIMALDQDSLVALLADPEALPFARSRACQRLAVIGGKPSVAALAPLLKDPVLSHYARFALETIPDPAADEVLRGALGELNGRLLVGVINSIGHRKDVKALPALGELLDDPDTEIARSAAAAMRRIRPAF